MRPKDEPLGEEESTELQGLKAELLERRPDKDGEAHPYCPLVALRAC